MNVISICSRSFSSLRLTPLEVFVCLPLKPTEPVTGTAAVAQTPDLQQHESSWQAQQKFLLIKTTTYTILPFQMHSSTHTT
jgi:hypothetical protein